MRLLLITTAAVLLLAVGSDAQSSWLGSIKSWLRPSRQTRPQNGAPPQGGGFNPQASQPFPSVRQQGQQQGGFQVKVNPDSPSRNRRGQAAADGDVARVSRPPPQPIYK